MRPESTEPASQHLNAEELEIQARANAATEGPWFFDCKDDIGEGRYQIIQAGGFGNPSCGISVCETSHHDVIDAGDGLRLDLQHGRIEDARFISKARTDIPLLLERLAAARRELAERRWIPVTERLPEYDVDVMLWSADWPCAYVGYWRHSEEWIGRYHPEDTTQLPKTNPTRWAALPAPPAQEHSE